MATTRSAVITEIRSPQPATRVLELQMEGEEALGFRGGQYIIVHTGISDAQGKPLKRAYSIVSSDQRQDSFALAIQHIPGGVGSEQMHRLRRGDHLSFSGPWARAAPQAPYASEALPLAVVAASTGLSAALGLVQGQALAPYLGQVHLLVLQPLGLGLLAEADVVALCPGELGSLSFVEASAADLSQAIAPWVGVRSFKAAYLTGDGLLLAEAAAALASAGLPRTQQYIEYFFNKPTAS